MTKVVKKGYCADKRIVITETSFDRGAMGMGSGVHRGYNYAVTGGGWKKDNLNAEDSSAEECWNKAVALVRELHARAPVTVQFDITQAKTPAKSAGGSLDTASMTKVTNGHGDFIYVDYSVTQTKNSANGPDRFRTYRSSTAFDRWMTRTAIARWSKEGRVKKASDKDLIEKFVSDPSFVSGSTENLKVEGDSLFMKFDTSGGPAGHPEITEECKLRRVGPNEFLMDVSDIGFEDGGEKYIPIYRRLLSKHKSTVWEMYGGSLQAHAETVHFILKDYLEHAVAEGRDEVFDETVRGLENDWARMDSRFGGSEFGGFAERIEQLLSEIKRIPEAPQTACSPAM